MKTEHKTTTHKAKAGVMTTEGNVKTEIAPKPEEPKESASEIAKRIKARAKTADQFEYEDSDFAHEIFDKLPEGEFIIQEGSLTVIQKL